MSDAEGGCLTRDELAESLLFFRRRLAARLAVAFIARGDIEKYINDIPVVAEDLANAICERLAARETGDARGYK